MWNLKRPGDLKETGHSNRPNTATHTDLEVGEAAEEEDEVAAVEVEGGEVVEPTLTTDIMLMPAVTEAFLASQGIHRSRVRLSGRSLSGQESVMAPQTATATPIPLGEVASHDVGTPMLDL